MKKLLLFLYLIIGTNPLWSQDVITKINGDEIQAKITEITDNEVKYKKFNYQDGPTYTLKKNEIFMIKYPNGDKDVFGNSQSIPVVDTQPKVDTTRIYGIKIEKSNNPDYDVITFKNGEVLEGKVIDISESELTFTNKKGFIKMTSKNSEIEKISLLSSNEALNEKIKTIHVGMATKSNQLGGDGKLDDRLVGVKMTGYNEENDTLRKTWKISGGSLRVLSYDIGGSIMSKNTETNGTSVYMSGGGFSLGYASNNYKLTLPEYTGDLMKANWKTLIFGSGIGFSFNSTNVSVYYNVQEYNSFTGQFSTVRRNTNMTSTYSYFSIPLNIGYVFARGKYLTSQEWRGNMYGIIYRPSFMLTMSDGESQFKFNPIGFGFEFSRGGLQNSLDKIAPKPHWRIGLFILPPIGSLPFTLSINGGITLLKSLKKKK